MTDEKPINLTPEQLCQLQALDEALYAQLDHHFTQVKAIKNQHGADMVYDPTGPSAFVIVGFNHPVSLDGVPEGVTADDMAVAIASVSIACMPEVHADPVTNTIGPAEAAPHGVQAVAAGMLLSSLQQGAVYETMAMAQSEIIRRRRMM